MKIQIETKNKLHTLHFGFFSIENSKELYGYTNKCPDSQYIILLDYDGWTEQEVDANQMFLEEKWGVKFRYKLKTNKGFHLISLDKVPYNYLREILYDSLCDPAFVKVPFETALKSSTLRISEKNNNYPELVKQYPFGRSEFSQSYGHYEMLKIIYPGLLKPEGQFDETNMEDIEYVKYWSKPK